MPKQGPSRHLFALYTQDTDKTKTSKHKPRHTDYSVLVTQVRTGTRVLENVIKKSVTSEQLRRTDQTSTIVQIK